MGARESQIAELRSVEADTSAEPTESPPDVSLDSAFASILKKKVYLLVDTENALSQSHRRIKHLEEQFQQNTVPKGLKIKPLKAKSKSEDLQKFDDILHETEVKLFGVTLESLRKGVLETEHSIARCKEDINAPSADGELRVRSRAKNPPKKLIYWLNTSINSWMFSTFNARLTKHPKLSKTP